jgi:cation-transporting ATPase 13A3/4/5
MVAQDERILLGDLNAESGEVEWHEVSTEGTPAGPFTTGDVLGAHVDAELAMTGAAFANLSVDGDMPALLLRTRIFARMSPSGKVKVIEQHIAKGLIVGMCGDGGNDCGKHTRIHTRTHTQICTYAH